MAKYTSPLTFSRSFGVDGRRISDLGSFDPILGADTPLFIDPLLLKQSSAPEMQAAHRRLSDYFGDIYRIIRASRAAGDLMWREAQRLLSLHEIPETCLGYGAGTTAGRAWGSQSTGALMTRAKELIDRGVDDPRLFLLVGLFSDNVGADMISDMTTNIILSDLVDFTRRICGELEIPMSATLTVASRKVVRLPENRELGNGVVLVPADILRELPIAKDYEDIWEAAAHNAALRDQVNNHLGGIWEGLTKRKKADTLREMMGDPEFVRRMIAGLMGRRERSYDIRRDPEGHVFWADLAYTIATEEPLELIQPTAHTVEELDRIVVAIIGQFRFLLEQRDLWRVLHDTPSRKTEKTAQRLFFSVAFSYVQANNLDIIPEADTGNGPVDFKFSVGAHPKVLVELKLSKGRVEHGYTDQLPTYMDAEDADVGHYVVLDVGSLREKWNSLQRLHSERADSRMRIHLIDATVRESASRRRSA